MNTCEDFYLTFVTDVIKDDQNGFLIILDTEVLNVGFVLNLWKPFKQSFQLFGESLSLVGNDSKESLCLGKKHKVLT